MKNLLFILTLSLSSLLADFQARVYPIAPKLQEKMIEGNTWQKGCPVAIKDLRYLRLTYHDFDGEDQVGELIVHKDIANEMVTMMQEVYNLGYPIRQMRLISEFKGNDWQSIEADNTSAFNCRRATGSKKWSKHAYGKAIDINPLENPYISRKGKISHKASLKYRKRIHRDNSASDRAVLLPADPVTRLFKAYGYRWGGDWHHTKDYQHFAK